MSAGTIWGSLGGSPERSVPGARTSHTSFPRLEPDINWHLDRRDLYRRNLVTCILRDAWGLRCALAESNPTAATFHIDGLIVYEKLAREALVSYDLLNLVYVDPRLVKQLMRLRRAQLTKLAKQRGIPVEVPISKQILQFWKQERQ